MIQQIPIKKTVRSIQQPAVHAEHWKILIIQLAAVFELVRAMTSDFNFSISKDYSYRTMCNVLLSIDGTREGILGTLSNGNPSLSK